MADSSKGANSGVTPAITDQAIQFQPAPPGALEALAAQMQAGYGGGQAANLEYLANLYRPMSLPMPRQFDPENPPAGGGKDNPLSPIFDQLDAKLDPLRNAFDPILDLIRNR